MGARACRADRIMDFLSYNTADTIYLVGDIFDLWHPNASAWTHDHDRVVQTILRRARDGTRVIYLAGNHDETVHRIFAWHFERIEVASQVMHRTADGRSFLVLHGDSCDAAWQKSRLITRIGSRIEDTLRAFDSTVKFLRRNLRAEGTGAIENLLVRFNKLLRMGNRYERRLTDLARSQGAQGVICGHFHQAALHESYGLIYANCGDWVAAMTAITEDDAGNLALLNWNECLQERPAIGALPQAAAHARSVVR